MVTIVAPSSPPAVLDSALAAPPKGRRSGVTTRLRVWWSGVVDRFRRWIERFPLGNLAPRLLPGGDFRIVDGQLVAVGPDPQFFFPERAYPPGFYVLVLHVRGPEPRGYAKLYVDDGTGPSEERAYGLVTKHEKSVFRIVHLPAGAVGLRLDPAEQAGPIDVPIVRFHRVTESFAWRRMLRRIGLEHARLATQQGTALRAAIAEFAREKKLSVDAAIFRLYCDTFGLRRSRGDYDAWMRLVEAPENAALEPWPADRPGPTISVLVPTYDTDPDHLRACIESVLGQSYPHVELCIADDASQNAEVRKILADYASRDSRVRVHYRTENGHICRATNDALALATGDYVALLDHDDLLAEHALLRVARAISHHPDVKLLYGDEDKLDQGGQRKDPHFKPDFNPELLLSQAYIGHLVVARAAEVRAVGGFRPGYEGSQDHDLVLRLSERCERREILHLPSILYHWRESEGSTALRADAKSYTADAGLRAVHDALARRAQPARVEHAPLVPHGYRVRFEVPSPHPLVSLLIPTRDKAELLRKCLGSLLERTTYPAYEVLIIDNGSTEPETFAYFDEVVRDPRVRLVRDDSPFNFSALNNLAARRARGDILGLVNNDIEAIHGDWLDEMVSHAARPDVGCVGAKLLYLDDRVQHAGVITGIGGVAGHAHKYLHRDEPGYFGRLHLTHSLSAVTAACLFVRRSVFEQAGGLDEELAVAFNDVDFCLRVRDLGYRNVFTPFAVLYHHESASRGQEVTPEKQERFRREAETMKLRWGATLRRDPAYSPHLSLEHEDFSIAVGG